MIRPATFDDVPKIVAMGREFWKQTSYAAVTVYDPHAVAPYVRHLIETGAVFVAHEGNEMIGMIGAGLTSPFFDPAYTVAVECFWYVAPEHRRGGAGSALLDALEEWCPSRARGLILMHTPNIAPEVMKRLYRKRGFVPWDCQFFKQASPSLMGEGM